MGNCLDSLRCQFRGTQRDRPVIEQDAGDPTSAYGIAKWQAEQRRNGGRSASLDGAYTWFVRSVTAQRVGL